MFRTKDEKGGDDEVLCVPAQDPRPSICGTSSTAWRSSISSRCTRIWSQASVEGATWVGRAAAEAEIERSYQRLKDSGRRR